MQKKTDILDRLESRSIFDYFLDINYPMGFYILSLFLLLSSIFDVVDYEIVLLHFIVSCIYSSNKIDPVKKEEIK